ncbi:MAG TPA: lipid A biosynthesis acyltransferase [Rubrivivax sp.]|nr:lipid A biosynthesis acyltransferase [Rubrivivax sp.]
MKRPFGNAGAHLLLALVWLLHWLPLPLVALLGRGFGHLLHLAMPSRRRVVQRNLALCFPELSTHEQRALAREHFALLGRSVLERGVLWHASPSRLKRLIRIEGDIGFAERHPATPVMWLTPHFLASEGAGMATQLFQKRAAFSMYQAQSNLVMDDALRRGRNRFGTAELFSRKDGARAIVRAVRRGLVFFNLPDMDFGVRDAEFVPFFGVQAATLLAPSRLAQSLNMTVQPVIGIMLPGGQGYSIRFLPPWTDWPSSDPVADAARLNAFIEEQVRLHPAQYFWVHKRFKTRPPGEARLY